MDGKYGSQGEKNTSLVKHTRNYEPIPESMWNCLLNSVCTIESSYN